MEYINENFINNNDDNDLSFVPLNIKQDLNPINSSFPLLMNLDSLSISIATNGSLNTLQLPNLPIGNSMPIIPYPDTVPNMETISNLNNTEETNLEYPSEINSDDLYSYNEDRFDDNYLINTINPLDILRNFDLSPEYYDYRNESDSNNIDSIFNKIEKNNPGILATMKAYRIPYPIAKLLIKKIISLTLRYEQR